MVKLIIQKKIGTTTTEISVCSAKVLDLFLWCLILILVLGILGFVGRSAAPLVGQLGGKMTRGFFFVCFPWSCGLCVTSRSSEVVSPDDLFVSSI
jgi:hypothetical protein